MQTTFSAAPTVARAGMRADVNNNVDDVKTVVCDDANGDIPFGHGVTLGTAGDPPSGTLPDATGEISGVNFLGVSLRDPTREATDDGYEDGETFPVLRKGRIWVISEDAVTGPTAAYCRFSASGQEKLGAFRTDADTADAVAVPSGKLLTPCDAGGLTILELG